MAMVPGETRESFMSKGLLEKWLYLRGEAGLFQMDKAEKKAWIVSQKSEFLITG